MLTTLISIFSVAVFGAIGWAVQLSNRVSATEQGQEDVKDLINARFDELDRRLEKMEVGIFGKKQS